MHDSFNTSYVHTYSAEEPMQFPLFASHLDPAGKGSSCEREGEHCEP